MPVSMVCQIIALVSALTAGPFLMMDAWAIEKVLYGIRLGSDYGQTRQMLIGRHGQPLLSKRDGAHYDSFRIGKTERNSITIGGNEKHKGYVESVALSGSDPIAGLHFIGGINLGMEEESIPELLAKPTQIQDSPEGHRHYEFGYTNFSIETRYGKIASVEIDLSNSDVRENLDQTALLFLSSSEQSALARGKTISDPMKDELIPYCRLRYPIRNVNNLYMIDANIYNERIERKGSFTFLLDTGWSDEAISSSLYHQIAQQQTLLAKEENPPKEAIGGYLGIGPEMFSIDMFHVDDSPILRNLGVDGVIGSSIFFAGSMILNLQREYICFPIMPLDKIAEKLDFEKVRAEYDSGRIWIDFHADNTVLRDYFLDTGANITSLLADDIARLDLSYRSMNSHLTINGKQLSLTFGPLVISWPGISHELDYIYQADDPAYRKIGTDVLGSLIIGIDASSHWVYLSD